MPVAQKRDRDILTERRRLAIQLTAAGKSTPEVAALLGCTRQAVWAWLSRHQQGGEQALDPVMGRPPALTEEDVRALVRAANEAGDVHTWLAMHAFSQRQGYRAGEAAVRRRLQAAGYKPRAAQSGRTRWVRTAGE